MTKVKTIKDSLTSLTTQLLDLLQISADINVEVVDGEEPSAEVVISNTEHAGLLIGNKGETLSAIQSFLSIALKNQTGEWVRVNVNVGDWRERQEQYLMELANQAVTRAIDTSTDQYLYNLNSAQRRIIHMALAENENIETRSEGEGAERYLVVSPKQK